MTKQEFTTRTGIEISDDDYNSIIEPLYMALPHDKDDFCKLFNKSSYPLSDLITSLSNEVILSSRIARIRHQERMDCARLLIGKAHTYDDTDLYRQAIKLTDQKTVTMTTLEMQLPLFEEDIEYIKNNLK